MHKIKVEFQVNGTRRIWDLDGWALLMWCVLVGFVACGVQGCAGQVVDAPDYCEAPTQDTPGCVTEGESPFWGPGPNTYCLESDGTEWHVYQYGATRYTKVEGTRHSPDKTLCDVAPDGRPL